MEKEAYGYNDERVRKDWYKLSDRCRLQKVNEHCESILDNGERMVLFKKYYDYAKECGSKSITINLKKETMTINVE